MNAKQLYLGYQYTKTLNSDNSLSFYKDANVYFVNGFVSGVHIDNTFVTYSEAKKYFNSFFK